MPATNAGIPALLAIERHGRLSVPERHVGEPSDPQAGVLCFIARRSILALTMLCRLLVGLVPFTSIACAPNGLAVRYSQYSGCPVEKVVVTDLDTTNFESDKHRVSGCGDGIQFYCRDDRCASPEITVATRHARQFGCVSHGVTVEELGQGAWMAKGCGHALTYQCFESAEHQLRCIAETGDETNHARRRALQE